MNNIINKSDEYIVSFLNGKLNKEETAELEQWISSSAANLELFETYRRIWLGTAVNVTSGKFDPDSAWDNTFALPDRLSAR